MNKENRTLLHQSDLETFERYLEQSLSPITPDPGFIKDLQQRLTSPSVEILEQHPLPAAYLIVAFGLYFGAFLFWLLRKLYRSRIKFAVQSK